MASWHSPSERSRRSGSPTSPLSPLPPHGLPQWLRPTRSSAAVIPPGRYKVLLVAFTCIMLGWFMTSALGPSVQEVPDDVYENPYMASTGVLNDPGAYEPEAYRAVTSRIAQPSAAVHDGIKHKPVDDKAPSIKGALGDLHKAVSDKIHGWGLHGQPQGEKAMNETLFSSTASAGPSNTSEEVLDGQSEAARLGARTRIGKCTILFNGGPYWERAIRTHETHDRLHDYRLHVLRQNILDDVWSKPAYILSLLLRELAKPEHERLEWLFWVDADTIILNPHVPIETFLPPPDFEDVNLLYSEDWNGLNNGVFPVRVNKWAVELFSAIVTYRYYRPNDSLVFRDQSAMNTLMREPKFAANIMKLPQRWFNAYMGEHNETLAPYQIRRGDFLVHFAGVTDRQPRMSFWLDRAEQHLDDWEVPLKSTSYSQEVKDFWGEQRVARQNLKNSISEARLASSELVAKTERNLADFADRLSTEQVESIKKALESLKALLGDDSAANGLDAMLAKTKELEEASTPLTAAQADSHKVLLSSAHDSIFAAEKELVEAGFYAGVTSPAANELDEVVKKLKEMVLSSEGSWDRATLSAAVDAATSARGKVQELKAAADKAAAAASASAVAAAAASASAAEAELTANRLQEEQRLRALQYAQQQSESVPHMSSGGAEEGTVEDDDED